MSWPVDGIQESWRADFLFSGGLVTGDRFTRVQVVFDCLIPWAAPAGIARGEIGSDDVSVDTRRITVDQAILGDRTRVRLCTGVEGRWDHSRVHLDQWAAFEVTSLVRKAKTIRGVLEDWVRPLQDLLVVSLGRPVRIDELAVCPRGQSGRTPLLDVACQLIQPRPGDLPRAADIGSYTAPTLLTYRDLTARDAPVSFAELIPAWFGLHERLSDVVTGLCGPYYAPFIYSGHRYASTFQSAEALAHGIFDSKEKTRPEHRARVDAVAAALEISGLDTENLCWARRVLLSRNDKPLRQLMEELITRGRPDRRAADPRGSRPSGRSRRSPGSCLAPGIRRPERDPAVLDRRSPHLGCPRAPAFAAGHPHERCRPEGHPAGVV